MLGQELRDRAASDATTDATPIEFAGWLPIFDLSGQCGSHPQFKHTASPPPGYRFTCSAPVTTARPRPTHPAPASLLTRTHRIVRGFGSVIRPLFGLFRPVAGVTLGVRLRVITAMVRMFRLLRRDGARLGPTLRFLQSRHLQSQLLIARQRGVVFLPSIPYTYGQDPWLVEIEDPTTLFYPLIQNGGTRHRSLRESPYFPIVKSILDSEQCKGIITHIRSTAEMIATLFDSEKIRVKTFYVPLGVRLPDAWQHHEETEHVNLLFTNSWHQMRGNFFLRGGLDVLEAFAILHERYPQLRLTLRTRLPRLPSRYKRILEEGWVRVIDRFLSIAEMEALLADSHVYLLPAARVHIVSLLQAMSHGLAVVASDGWGFDEYVAHRRNGLVVKGRYGKVSWADHDVGMLRENYRPMYKSNAKVVRGLVNAVSRLVENPALRKRLGQTARRDVETTYNLERWNAGLKEVFDNVLPRV